MTDSYDEATALWPKLGRYKKFIVSLTVSTVPFVIFLTSATHSASEVVAASAGYVLLNLGVRQVPNDQA